MKDKYIRIRLSTEEDEMLRSRAASMGMSLSQYVISCCCCDNKCDNDTHIGSKPTDVITKDVITKPDKIEEPAAEKTVEIPADVRARWVAAKMYKGFKGTVEDFAGHIGYQS